jgi:Transposase IS66 family
MGLAAHRDYPMTGLDNNAAERMIRGPVVTRKNARGSHNGDSARNAAVIWTVTATIQMAGLNILTWLTAYFDECGRNADVDIPTGEPLPEPSDRCGALAARRFRPTARATGASVAAPPRPSAGGPATAAWITPAS